MMVQILKFKIVKFFVFEAPPIILIPFPTPATSEIHHFCSKTCNFIRTLKAISRQNAIIVSMIYRVGGPKEAFFVIFISSI